MSDLKAKLESEMKDAVRSQDKLRLTTIRMVRSSIKNKEIDTKKTLDDGEVISILSTMIKQRTDSIKMFRDGGREDLAVKEEAEIIILQEFLPPPMTKEEVRVAVEKVIQKVGAKGLKDIGKVMKEVAPLTAGRALGREVNEIVKELLTAS